MSIFSWIGSLFEPATKLIDEIVTTDEERGEIEIKKAELRNKLAEIEAKVATRTLELQGQIVEQNGKIAVAEQEHGNWLSKSHRPITSLAFATIIILMGLGYVPVNELIIKIGGSFLGIYAGGRTFEKVKKV